jgi:hypothetical protein
MALGRPGPAARTEVRRRTYLHNGHIAFDHGKCPNWKWWCKACGSLTNDGECDCTKHTDNADLQVLIRNP